MTSEVFQRIDRIKRWKRGEDEAPLKPLLLLYALKRWHADRTTRIPFSQVDRDLTPLLRRFNASAPRPEYPFCRLRTDGLWELEGAEGLETRASNTDIKKSELLANDVRGGFTRVVLDELERDPGLALTFAERVLERHFDADDHAAVREAVGLPQPQAG
jgi:putative restriction endonuclease